MNIRPVRTRVFKEGEDLFAFITRHVPKLKEGSVLAVTSKIVALSEGRTAFCEDEVTREKIIRSESEFAIPTKWVWLTIKDGAVMANAGTDESNADGKLVLLPKDSFKSANALCRKLKKKYRIKKLGVLITDSRTIPLRAGVTAVALGYAGFKGVRDYRGKRDIFGRLLYFTQVNVADELSAAAALLMGEGSEQRPLAVIESAPVEFIAKVNREETYIPLEDDMYRPLFLHRKI